MALLALTSTTKIVATLARKSTLPRSEGTDSLASSLKHRASDLANKVLQSSLLCVKATPKPVNLSITLLQPASKTTEQQQLTITCTTHQSIRTPPQPDKPNEGRASRESTQPRVQAAWAASAASTATMKDLRRASGTHTFTCAITSSETSNTRCSS